MTQVKMTVAAANVSSFKSLFNTIDTIIHSLTFECYRDRVEINCLDKSKTVFMSCVLDRNYFDDYECDEEDRFTIDTTHLKKILKSCKSELCIMFEEDKCSIKSLSKVFELILVNDDFSSPKPNIPSLYVQGEIPVDYIKSAIKDIALFTNDVLITAAPDKFTFSCEGVVGNFIDEYILDDVISTTHSVQKVKVAVEKFSTCIGADKISDNVKFDVGSDMPLILLMENEGISVKFLIAPKVDMSE